MGPVFTSRPVQPPEFTRCTVVAEDPHPFEFSKSVGSRAGVRDGSLFVEHAACDACRRLRPVDGRHSGHVAQALHPRIHLFGRLDSLPRSRFHHDGEIPASVREWFEPHDLGGEPGRQGLLLAPIPGAAAGAGDAWERRASRRAGGTAGAKCLRYLADPRRALISANSAFRPSISLRSMSFSAF